MGWREGSSRKWWGRDDAVPGSYACCMRGNGIVEAARVCDRKPTDLRSTALLGSDDQKVAVAMRREDAPLTRSAPLRGPCAVKRWTCSSKVAACSSALHAVGGVDIGSGVPTLGSKFVTGSEREGLLGVRFSSASLRLRFVSAGSCAILLLLAARADARWICQGATVKRS